MMLTRSLGVMVGLVGMSGMAACGGASSDAKPIASIPAYPDANDQSPAKTETTSADAPKDAKTICAGADDSVKVSLASDEEAPKTLRSLDERDRFADDRSSRKAKDQTYAMADLQALEKKGAWEELLAHAEDIPPAQRSAAWEKTVEKAAIGYLQQLGTDTAAFEGVFTSQALLGRYPHLLKSSDFMAKRGEAGKAASAICLKNAYRGQHCIDMMKDFLKTQNTAPETGFAFGKIVRLNQNAYVAVPFFRWALDQKKDAGPCADEDLSLAVVAGLGLPPDYDNAQAARHVAVGACWDQLKPAIRKELIASPTGYAKDNICAVLKSKGAL